MRKMNIGFIGLGLMGNPMAKNILKAGFPLAVYNRTKSKLKEFENLGCRVFETPGNLAGNVDIVISMVTGPRDVEEIYMGKDGIIHRAKNGLIAIDMGTIGTVAAQKVAQKLGEKNIEFLDAPVTGGVYGAEKGELTIFIGGKKEVFEKVKPIFLAMGKKLYYMGPCGCGQTMKLVNNTIIATTLAGFSEGLLLAEYLGLSISQVSKILSSGWIMSPLLKLKLPSLVKNDFPVTFSVKNMSKDLDLALSELKIKSRVKLPISEATGELFLKGTRTNLAESDIAAIIEIIRRIKN